jgi:hypothetical protein
MSPKLLKPLISASVPAEVAAPQAAAALPPVPVPPPNGISFSNLPAWIVYFGSLALFILGLLTALGVTLPDHVTTEVQTWAGVAPMVAAVIAPLIALLSHHSVLKAAIASPTTVVAPPAP